MNVFSTTVRVTFLTVFSTAPLVSWDVLPNLAATARCSKSPFPRPVHISMNLAMANLSKGVHARVFPPQHTFHIVTHHPTSVYLSIVRTNSDT